MSSGSALTQHDVATYLPRKPIQEFARKHTIYGPGQPCNHVYLIRSGRVVISSSFDNGSPMVNRIAGPNGIFGESLLISLPEQTETAVVLDQTRLMSWDRNEIEQLVSRDPRLGLALLTYFVKRCSDLNERLDALAFRKTPERVMLGMLQLAETLGTPTNDAMRLAPLTHQVIAEYVGTSREIVTSHMSELRRSGLLQYSRKFIDVNVNGMRAALEQQGIKVRPADIPMARAAF